jgi:hypothetical protein
MTAAFEQTQVQAKTHTGRLVLVQRERLAAYY